MKADPATMSDEVRGAITYRDVYLKGFDELKRRVLGPGYLGKATRQSENYAFEYMALVLPLLAFQNPRAKVGTRLAQFQEEEAEYIGLGLNTWIYDTKQRTRIVKMVRDMVMRWGVTFTQPEPLVGFTGKDIPHRPVSRRIAQDRFFVDHLADELEECRFKGHSYVTTKTALLERAKREKGWDVKYIESLEAGAGVSRENDTRFKEASSRDEIGVCEIIVPENSTDNREGYNGTVYRLVAPGESSSTPPSTFLREPHGFYGPHGGGYTVYGCYSMGGYLYPLASLAAVQEQGDNLCAASAAVQTAAEKYKRILIGSAKDPKWAALVKDGVHDYVYDMAGFEAKDVISLEIGGFTEHLLAHREMKRQELDRALGMGDMQRGIVTGVGTATENSLAATSSNARLDFLKQNLYDAETAHLSIVAWYLYSDNRIWFPTGNGHFFGGRTNKDLIALVKQRLPGTAFEAPERNDSARFEDLMIEIEPYSMERTSEQTQQAQGKLLLELMTTVGPMIPQLIAAGVDVSDGLNKIGSTVNMPNLGSILNAQLAQEAARRSIEQAAMQAQGPARGGTQPAGSSGPKTMRPTRMNGAPRPAQNGATHADLSV